MNFSQADLPFIKWSLLTLCVALLLGGGAVIATQTYAGKAQKEKISIEQQLSNARSRLNTAREDLQNMSTYTREFSALQQRGLIGEEKRLHMIEDLNLLQRRNYVLDLKYSISPQQAYKAPVPLDSGNYDLMLSPMTLQLGMLHEGQLMHLLDGLRKDMHGWFILNRCMLVPVASTSSFQLKAECEGGWLTIKNRNAP